MGLCIPGEKGVYTITKGPQAEGESVLTIVEGPAAGNTSNRSAKAYSRLVAKTEWPSKRARTREVITFSDVDLINVAVPHEDAIIFTAGIGHCDVAKCLVDTGSSVDIIFYHAYQRMQLTDDQLQPVTFDLISFSRDPITVKGGIQLPVILGQKAKQRRVMVEFMVVDRPSAHNVILGRPSLNKLKACMSTYYLVMKFLTEDGVGECRTDQGTSR